MKKLLLFPALLFAGISSHAQITIMPEAGINFSNLTSKWSISGADQTKSYTMQPGFRAGASVHIKFAPHLGIQPGIYFDYSSCKTENTVLGVTTRFTTQLSAIQVPVYLTFYSNNAINGGFFAGVGPFVNYYLSGKTKTKVSSGIRPLHNKGLVPRCKFWGDFLKWCCEFLNMFRHFLSF